MLAQENNHTLLLQRDTQEMHNCNPQGERTTKTVRFSESPPQTVVLDERTREETRQSWCSNKELWKQRKKELKRTVSALQRVGGDVASLDSSLYCTRGLEHTRDSYREYKRKQEALVEYVLQEQHRQRGMGIVDPKALQVTSSVCTKFAKQRAMVAAAWDALEAAGIMAEEEEEPNNSTVCSDDKSWCSSLLLRQRMQEVTVLVKEASANDELLSLSLNAALCHKDLKENLTITMHGSTAVNKKRLESLAKSA